MKKTHKKLVGGLLAGMLIATIGAVIATGANDDTTDDATEDTTTNTPPQGPFGDHHGMREFGMFGSELTDEQQTELEGLMTSLRKQNATPDEMRTAIQEKLNEFGVLDARLDNEIVQTEQRLTILNRQKELRDEGYSWDEITSIIEDEFDLENATGIGNGWGMMGRPGGFGHGPRGGPREKCNAPEESEQ